MGLLDRINRDIKKGINEGVAAVRKGAAIAVVKAEELAEEGKRRYRIFELKQKMQSSFAELGGKVYDLANKNTKDVLLDTKVKSTISGIKKLEAHVARLEKSVKKSRRGAGRSGRKKKN